jgi:hypothetical protein
LALQTRMKVISPCLVMNMFLFDPHHKPILNPIVHETRGPLLAWGKWAINSTVYYSELRRFTMENVPIVLFALGLSIRVSKNNLIWIICIKVKSWKQLLVVM